MAANVIKIISSDNQEFTLSNELTKHFVHVYGQFSKFFFLKFLFFDNVKLQFTLVLFTYVACLRVFGFFTSHRALLFRVNA